MLVFRGHPVVLVQHVRTLDLFARDEARIAVVDDLHTAQHLTNDHFNVLVVDLHALQTVHVLHFVHDVARQRLDTLQTQDVVRIGRTVDDHFALVDDLTIVHQHLLFLRDQELVLFAFEVGDDETLLALRVLTERRRTRDFRQNAGVLRRARFEQFGHARQTTGNVTRLLRFNRDTCQHFTDLHLLTILHGDQCADLEADLHRMLGVRDLDFFALRVEQLHLRTNALRRLRTAALHVDHDERRKTRHIVDLLRNRHAFFDVFELHRTAPLGDDRTRQRIPLSQLRAGLDLRAVELQQRRAVRDLVTFTLATVGRRR